MKFFFLVFFTAFLITSFSNAKNDIKKVDINLIKFRNDEDHNEKKGYTGIILGKKYPQNRAILTGIEENKVKLSLLKTQLVLKEHFINDLSDFSKLTKGFPKNSITILDLPEKIMEEIINILPEGLAFINARISKNSFREKNCKKNLFNIIPSDKMYTDSLAQFLILKNWKNVLVLYGPKDEDQNKYLSFLDSSKKYKLKIINERKFTLSKNPEDREANNPKLLTKGKKSDTIVIFDYFGEFSRNLPFNTMYPTPVVGDIGLTPRAWHWAWERNGAPQLNKRFQRNDYNLSWEVKDRKMQDSDWAAWVSIKIIAESLKIKDENEKINFLKLFQKKTLAVDMYKGKVGSFRNWNNQLRQPILLSTHNAVITKMPNEKFLHKINAEDTLGFDISDSKCLF